MSTDSVTATPITLPIQPVGNEVILWSKPGCVQCTATERTLTDRGLDFTVLNLNEHPAAIDAIRAAGRTQAPVVQFQDDVWTGFRPDKIDGVVARVAAEART